MPDAVVTLRWVVARLGRIQAVQDEHTLRLERVENRLDRLRRGWKMSRRG